MSDVPLFTLNVAAPPASAIAPTNARASGVVRGVRLACSGVELASRLCNASCGRSVNGDEQMQQLRILIWHVHGSYLYYFTQAPHLFYLPSSPERTGDLVGRYGHLPWGKNVIDVPVQEVKKLELDCIIFQLPKQYLKDQHEILSAEQRNRQL